MNESTNTKVYVCRNFRQSASGLFVVAQYPAGRSIDQVHLRARKTSHGLIDLAFAVRRSIREPSLHIEARCGAAIDEGCHFAVLHSRDPPL